MSYTNSPLVSFTRISPNKNSPRNHIIDTISIHCVVGQLSVESLGNIFANKSRQSSCNYGIGSDGRIGLYVEEKDRSWCTSSASNDNRAITIEVASDTTHPYKVNDKAYKSLINLLVDICKRNGIKKLLWKADKSLIGKVDKQNMTVHRWFANKACPGDYLYNLHGQIAEEVNKQLGTSTTPVTNTTTSSKLGFSDIQVNTIYKFIGKYHYISSTAKTGAITSGNLIKVLKKHTATSAHPIYARSVDAQGNFISGVYGWININDIERVTTEEYRVQVTADALNIRLGPGTNYRIVGKITDKGIYTITQIKDNWGRLKSDAGWISLRYTKKL